MITTYHYMKSGTLFRQVFNRINEIDFTPYLRNETQR